MLFAAKIIDLIEAKDQESLKAEIRDSNEYDGQHIGWAIAENSLKQLDISGDELFAFLEPEFPGDWEAGVSWDMLSESQKNLVL